MHQIIAIAGRIGSGKSSVSAALAADLGWHFASFGDFVRQAATSRGVEQTRETLQAIGEELEASDPKNFCRSVLDNAGWQLGEPAVVEGVRHVRIWDTLKDLVAPQPIFLIYLDASQDLRRSRLLERGAQEANYLDKVEAHSTERDIIAEIPQLADLVLSTDGKEIFDLVSAIKRNLALQRWAPS